MTHRINISIDDVSPHPLSGLGVLDRCARVLERHPNVKFTLFVPTAYYRTILIHGRPDTTTKRPLFLAEHSGFCNQLRALPRETYELCFHGRFHGVRDVSNNDEFRRMIEAEFEERYTGMLSDVVKAKLDHLFKPVFRPPAMYMSADSIRAARRLGVECLALSPRTIHKASYGGAELERDDVVYANVWLPDDPLPSAVTEDLELLYHACEWDGGFFDDAPCDKLIAWLDEHIAELEPCFMQEMLRDRMQRKLTPGSDGVWYDECGHPLGSISYMKVER